MLAKYPALSGRLLHLPTRVALLVGILLLPMVALAFYLAHLMEQQTLHQLRSEAQTIARSVAAQQGATLKQARRHLAALAAAEELAGDDRWCAERLGNAVHSQSAFYQIAYADSAGRLVCAAKPLGNSANVSVADRPYFMGAVSSKNYVLSNGLQSRADGRWTVVAAQPIFDAPGALRGVLVGAIDLGWAQDALAGLQLPIGSIISLSDADGKIIARVPDPQRFVGRHLREAEAFRQTIQRQSEGIMDSAGLDGTPRVIAFKQVPDAPLYVRIGVPRTEVQALGRHTLYAAFTVIAAVLAVSLLVGWFGADRLVLRPLRRLTQAARNLGAGDWTARTGLPHRPDAMGRLAEKLDELAEHGQRTARAYKALSGGNRTLLRERHEPTLLREMCRVAVEKGGYALAFVAYAEHDADKTIRVTAHHGRSDGFVEDLRMTWADAERGQSTIGTAIRTGRHCIIRDMSADERLKPWHAALTQRGFGAAISLPLTVDDKTIGTFTLLTTEVDAFDDEEVLLLDEMAADLSFGIQNIRGYERQKSAELVAERLLTHDHPTALPNRVLFLQGLGDAIEAAATECESVAVLIVHMVRLQEIVDGFGYDPGQGVIREVAARLKGAVADYHLLARLEVDEFAVFLRNCDPAAAGKLADTLLTAFHEPVHVAQAQIDVSATVGVAFYPGHGGDAEALVRRAAIAARDGVNRDRSYNVYRGATERENPSRLALAAELRTAIGKGDLVLFYQPKVDLKTNVLYGSEALVRWPHPSRGLVPPGQFVPLAEETGLIRPMTTRLVEMAIRQQHMWMRSGRALPVAVNLSVRNLYDPLFLESLETLLETWGVSANLIDFEITESALVDDPDTAKRILTRLRQLGSRIYIDDFGTGYSSLNYLVTLPVHALKVDQSFVRQMEASPEAHSVVASIISMAHNLGLEVIAEGVETEAHRKTLAALGCDKMQGYLVSKPLPSAEFEERFLRMGEDEIAVARP